MATLAKSVRRSAKLSQRLYATATSAAEPFPGVAAVNGAVKSFGEIQRTTLSNGVVVCSQDNGGVASSVSIAVNAGTRCETHNNAGVTHMVRNLAFQDTNSHSIVKITRETELRGAQLSASSGREHISYNARFLRGDEAFVGSVLADTVADPLLQEWIVSKQQSRVAADLAAADSTVAVIDDAHRAAFRNTALGRPIVCSASQASAVNLDTVVNFRQQFFTPDNVVVCGVDCNHADLVATVEGHLNKLGGAKASTTATKYFGGEVVTPTAGNVNQTVLGFRGVTASSPDYLASLLVRNLLGGAGPLVKWGTSSVLSPVGAALSSAVKSPFKLHGFSSTYSDESIIGTSVAFTSTDVEAGVQALASGISQVLQGQYSDDALAAAKAQLRTQLLLESAQDRVADMTSQLLSTGKYLTPEELVNSVNNISKDDIKKVTAHMTASRPFLATRGFVDNFPYLDTLGL